MDKNWIKHTHTNEKENLELITKKAIKDAESREIPTKQKLPEETKSYIDSRFQKNNDDNLQEDMAQKFVIDSDYLDTLHKVENKGEQAKKEINEASNKIYNDIVKYTDYLKAYTKHSNKILNLLNKLTEFEYDLEFESKNPFVNKKINKESIYLLGKAIENIKKELDTIKDENISSESVGEIFRKYTECNKKYEATTDLWNIDHPELN